MKTLIRVDSSNTIGTGHLMRCLVFAKKFENAVFAVRNLEGNLNFLIPYKKIILNSNSADELIKVIKKENITHVVIDSYEIDYEFEKKLKENLNIKLTVIDDKYRPHYCDEFINHNISADKKKYNKLLPRDCIVKCGEKYTLLRDEFKKALKKTKKKNRKFRIFLGLGGADTKNLTVDLLKILHRFNVETVVVTTSANKNIEKIKKYIKAKPWIKLYVNSENVAELIRNSDFGIISASSFANELYFMKLPFIAIKVADNQENMFRFLKKKGFPVMENFYKFGFLKLIRKELHDLR